MEIQEKYLHIIREAYSDLHISSIEFNNQGQNSDVIVINREFIFRFPKYSHVMESLKIETAILNHVSSYLPLDVPAPMFVNLENEVIGEAFIGYRLIPGEPLWRETFQNIDNQEVARGLAKQLAAFLKTLHSVPVDELAVSKLPVDTYSEIANTYTRIQEKLFDLMRTDAQNWAARHFEGFLGDIDNFEYTPVLKHGDFGPSNILFDKEKQSIVGVIDFGNSGMGDPAYDFAGLLSGYGERFVEYCSDYYPKMENLMRRIHFYQGTFALLEALFGIENGDDDALRAGLEKYT